MLLSPGEETEVPDVAPLARSWLTTHWQTLVSSLWDLVSTSPRLNKLIRPAHPLSSWGEAFLSHWSTQNSYGNKAKGTLLLKGLHQAGAPRKVHIWRAMLGTVATLGMFCLVTRRPSGPRHHSPWYAIQRLGLSSVEQTRIHRRHIADSWIWPSQQLEPF